jgi:hypothetical protein
MQLYNIANLPYGKMRRELIIQWLKVFRFQVPYAPRQGIPVNRKHQMQDSDPDLKYLIKKGVLTRYRPGSKGSGKYGKSGGRCNQTYLVQTDE